MSESVGNAPRKAKRRLHLIHPEWVRRYSIGPGATFVVTRRLMRSTASSWATGAPRAAPPRSSAPYHPLLQAVGSVLHDKRASRCCQTLRTSPALALRMAFSYDSPYTLVHWYNRKLNQDSWHLRREVRKRQAEQYAAASPARRTACLVIPPKITGVDAGHLG
jgi:hypothetical protein